MAAITTAASGNWSAPATWTGGVVPGNGDTVTLNHSVTVDTPVTVGSSPATGGTAAIAWGTANVVLAVNANLTLRGDIIPKDDFTLHDLIVQAAGTTVTFDATAAAAPATTHYRCLLFGTGSGWRWKFNGTVAQPCVLQSAAGAGVGFFDNNSFLGGPRINAAYTHFLRIGDASNIATNIYLGNGPAPEFTLNHCVIETCGEVIANNGTSTTVQSVTHSVFKGGLGSLDAILGLVESATSPGTVDDCYFAGELSAACGNMVLTNTVFVGNLSATSDPASTTCQSNLFGFDSSLSAPGTVDQCYYMDFNSANNNGHGVQLNPSFGHDLTNSVFETSYPTQGVGDMIGTVAPSAAATYHIRNNILVAAPDGTSPGKLVSIGNSSANMTLVVEHNTVVSDGATGTEIGVVQFGENGVDGAPGQVTSLKSNLAWSKNSGNAVILSKMASTIQDEVAAANAEYNATWNGMTGIDGLGYVSEDANHIFSSGTPGAHDKTVAADPFLDRTRNFAKWGASLGGAGTNADTLAMLRKRLDWTDGAYNPNNGATVQSLVGWVSSGFNVKATALKNAGHDGATIGAMPFTGGALGLPLLQLLEIGI